MRACNPPEGLVAQADRLRHALERSLICLILVLRRDGDAIKEVAIAEQGREDRDSFSPACHFRDVGECQDIAKLTHYRGFRIIDPVPFGTPCAFATE